VDDWHVYTTPETTSDTVTFAVFADPQENDELGYMAYAYDYYAVMEQSGSSMDFGMFVGDFVNDHDIRAQWDWYLQYSSSFCFGTPIAATIGNHENGAISDDRMSEMEYDIYLNLPSNGPVYETFSELDGDKRPQNVDRGKTYSFDYGPAHFIAIDTEIFCDGTTECATYDASAASVLIDWLEADLASSEAIWNIVFLHRGPYSMSYDSATIRSLLTPVFEEGGVDIVFSGHDHKYSRSVYESGNMVAFGRSSMYTRGTVSLIENPDGLDFNDYTSSIGVTYVVGNSAGTKFYRASTSSGIDVQFAFEDDLPVIPIVEVTADSIVVTSYVVLKSSPMSITGTGVEILETFRITK
jgi:hypothetical protein